MTGRWLEGALEGIISRGFKGFVHARFLFLYPKASVSANRGTQPSGTLTCGAAGPTLAFELHLGFISFRAVFSSSFSFQWLAWRQAGLALDLQPHIATGSYCVPSSSGCYLVKLSECLLQRTWSYAGTLITLNLEIGALGLTVGTALWDEWWTDASISTNFNFLHKEWDWKYLILRRYLVI